MIIKHILDNSYTLAITPGKYHADFKVYKINGTSMDETIRYYENENGMHDSTDISTASVYLSGGVKWDGCSNMQFDEQTRVMLHFCGKGNAVKIGELMAAVYDECEPHIERVDKSIYRD